MSGNSIETYQDSSSIAIQKEPLKSPGSTTTGANIMGITTTDDEMTTTNNCVTTPEPQFILSPTQRPAQENGQMSEALIHSTTAADGVVDGHHINNNDANISMQNENHIQKDVTALHVQQQQISANHERENNNKNKRKRSSSTSPKSHKNNKNNNNNHKKKSKLLQKMKLFKKSKSRSSSKKSQSAKSLSPKSKSRLKMMKNSRKKNNNNNNNNNSSSAILIDMIENNNNLLTNDESVADDYDYDNDNDDNDNDHEIDGDRDQANEVFMLYSNNDGNNFQRFLSSLDAYDKYYSSFIHNWEPGLWMDIILLFPTFIFSFIGIFLVTLIYAYYLHTLSYFIYALITVIISEFIKFVFRRPRPNPTQMRVERIINLSGILIARKSTSMPSGDTMQAAVLAICLGFATSLTYWWLAVIPFVGFGRIYFQKHYLGDVTVGAVLGIILGLILNAALDAPIDRLGI
jgi:membrane-associated phospholipid phosphatase